MSLDDLRKLATGPVLLSMESIIGARLVPLLYGLGLAAIGLWVIAYVFGSFALGFGEGLWGLITIAVFAPLAAVVLRLVCEAVLIYFKKNEAVALTLRRPRSAATLIDEVSAAIRDLAEDDEDQFVPATEPPPLPGFGADVEPHLPARPGLKRTARRTPKL
jgi:hypothetical protein